MRFASKFALGFLTVLGLATPALADHGRASEGGYGQGSEVRDDSDIQRLYRLANRYDEALAAGDDEQRQRVEHRLRRVIYRELMESRAEISRNREAGDWREARMRRKIQHRRMAIAYRLESMSPDEVRQAIWQLIRLERFELRLDRNEVGGGSRYNGGGYNGGWSNRGGYNGGGYNRGGGYNGGGSRW